MTQTAIDRSSSEPVRSRDFDPTLLLVAAVVNVVLFALLAKPSNIVREYRCFYAAAQMARVHLPLYDRAAQIAFQQEMFGDGGYLPFLHPPHELLVFVPLSFLPLGWSLMLYRCLSVVAAGISCELLARTLGVGRWTVVGVVFGLWSTTFMLLQGEDSIFVLLLLSAMLLFLNRGKYWAAGTCLALASIRPQVTVIVALALLIRGERRAVSRFAGVGAVILALSYAFVRHQGVHDYLALMHWTETHAPLTQMANLRAALAFFGSESRRIYGAIAGLLLLLCVPVWRRAENSLSAVALAICIAVLITPHVFVWELSLLTIPLLVMLKDLRSFDWVALSPLFLGALFIFVFAKSMTPLFCLPVAYLTARYIQTIVSGRHAEGIAV